MPIFSWVCFAIAFFIALGNVVSFYGILQKGGSTSFIPLVSLVFFILGTMGWDEPLYFWLFALLDIGTLAIMVSLFRRSS